MTDRTNHEKFMRGEPLNEELARIRAGDQSDDALTRPAQFMPPQAPDLRPLTITEKQHLAELRASAGWPILIRLLEKVVDEKERTATMMSKVEPLSRPEAVAREWATVAIYEALAKELQPIVDHELAPSREKDDESRLDEHES